MNSRVLLRYLICTGLSTTLSMPALAAWQQAFYSDFDTGVPSEFSGITSLAPVPTTSPGALAYGDLGTGDNRFGGDFLRNVEDGNPAASTVLTLTALPEHTHIELNFLLAMIDSWDGLSGNEWGPDYFNILIDGQTVLAEAFSHMNPPDQTYQPPAGVHLRTGALGFGGAWLDAAYDMGLDPRFDSFPHSADTLTIEWFASGAGRNEGIAESWAIENVEVNILVVPEPVTLSLLALGGLLVARRRR